MRFLNYIRGYIQRPLVRPWALAGPVLILMICLPLLRPLREPNPNRWSDQEQMTASTVQAIVENRTLAIDGTVFGESPGGVQYGDHVYSPYPPMLSLLLSPAYWIARWQGLSYGDDPIFVQYILTILGASVPAAVSAGLVYRLARVFELKRSLRVALGISCVAGTGLLTYGVLLNAHVPAAMLLLVAVSCMSHLAVAGHPYRDIIMALFAGGAAAMAAAVDPSAAMPAVLLCVVFLAMRWNASMRIVGVALYVLGAAPVVLLNMLLLGAAHGSPGSLQYAHDAMPSMHAPVSIDATMNLPDRQADDTDSDSSAVQGVWFAISGRIALVLESLVGEHGVLSHFPVLVVGLLGAMLVLHRNWSAPTKCLSAVVLGACLLLVVTHPFTDDASAVSYGAPWFICVSPLLLFWAGAWLKRPHRAQSWVMALIVLFLSLVVAGVGITNPMPRSGYRGYSFAQAWAQIASHEKPQAPVTRQ